MSSGFSLLVPLVRSLATTVTVIWLAAYWAVRATFTQVHHHGQAVGNTRIGHSLRFRLDRPNVREAVRQIGGGLALPAPLGVLLPIVYEHRPRGATRREERVRPAQ